MPVAVVIADIMLIGAAQNGYGRLLLWLGVLIVLVVIGGSVIVAAKRLLSDDEPDSSGGFTLQSLHELHAAGELSDEEFAKAKAVMIGQIKRDTDDSPEADNPASWDDHESPDKNNKNDIDPGDIGGPIGG